MDRVRKMLENAESPSRIFPVSLNYRKQPQRADFLGHLYFLTFIFSLTGLWSLREKINVKKYGLASRGILQNSRNQTQKSQKKHTFSRRPSLKPHQKMTKCKKKMTNERKRSKKAAKTTAEAHRRADKTSRDREQPHGKRDKEIES